MTLHHIPSAYTPPSAPPATGAIGWNFRQTDGFLPGGDGPIDLFSTSPQPAKPWTNGNGVSVTLAGFNDYSPIVPTNEDAGLDPRLAGYVLNNNSQIWGYWNIQLPNPGTVRVWAGYGTANAVSSTRMEVFDGFDNTVALYFEITPVMSNGQYASINNVVHASAQAWVDAYDASYMDFVITDKGATNTGITIGQSRDPATQNARMNHLRILPL